MIALKLLGKKLLKLHYVSITNDHVSLVIVLYTDVEKAWRSTRESKRNILSLRSLDPASESDRRAALCRYLWFHQVSRVARRSLEAALPNIFTFILKLVSVTNLSHLYESIADLNTDYFRLKWDEDLGINVTESQQSSVESSEIYVPNLAWYFSLSWTAIWNIKNQIPS